MDKEIKGFKAGLEIHQQLDTQRLFSRTPSHIREDAPDIVFRRFLRASAGEQGSVDSAALHEQQKQKYFLYEGYSDSDSLIEFDEEPIAEIEQNALCFAVSCAKLFKAFVPEHLVAMRKTVVDGSNTSGFQRTVLVGLDGKFEVKGKKIGIATLCLEEDAAKLIERTADYDKYNLSRLGIPLLEIATQPDITSPEQLKEVAQHIGLVLRNLSLEGVSFVKRGLGTIRQDVNVSITGGTRVEIKGAQALRLLPKLAQLEAERQQALLLLSAEFKKRKIKTSAPKDVTKLFSSTTSKLLKTALKQQHYVVAIKVQHAAGLIGKTLIPNRRFGTELAEYAKVVAGLSGIMHSDELPAYGVTEKEKEAVAQALSCKKDDAFLFVVGDNARTTLGLEAVQQRIQKALEGIPSEVRKALPDGTTSYLRPMSSASRLYPETDAKLITPPVVTGVDSVVIETPEELGVSEEFVTSLLRHQKMYLFKEIIQKAPTIKPAFIAETLLTYPKELKQLGYDSEKVTEGYLIKAFIALQEHKITKQSLIPLLAECVTTSKFSLAKFGVMNDVALKKALKQIVAQHSELPLNALVGKAMNELRGKADAQKIVSILKELKK